MICAQGRLDVKVTQKSNTANCNFLTNTAKNSIQQFINGQTIDTKPKCEQLAGEIKATYASDCYTITCDCVFPTGNGNSGSNSSNPFGYPQININGINQGAAFFSSTPATETENLIKQFGLQLQALFNNNSGSFTGKANFDKAYSPLVSNYNNGNRRETRQKSNNNNETAFGSYDHFKEIGAEAGVNIEDFFSPEAWRMENISSDEWDEKFRQFTNAIDKAKRKNYEKFTETLDTQLTLLGIDMVEFAANKSLTTVTGATLGPVGALVADVIGGAIIGGAAEAARQRVEPTVSHNVVSAKWKGGWNNVPIAPTVVDGLRGSSTTMERALGVYGDVETGIGFMPPIKGYTAKYLFWGE